MAKYSNRKTSTRGRTETLTRRASRAVKYATQPLDVEAILSTLDRPLVRVA